MRQSRVWVSTVAAVGPLWARCGLAGSPLWARWGPVVSPLWARCGAPVGPMLPVHGQPRPVWWIALMATDRGHSDNVCQVIDHLRQTGDGRLSRSVFPREEIQIFSIISSRCAHFYGFNARVVKQIAYNVRFIIANKSIADIGAGKNDHCFWDG